MSEEWPAIRERTKEEIRKHRDDRFPNNAKWTEAPPPRKNDSQDVSISVTSEERDYYYNLDFLTGTYHNHHGRFKTITGPCHGLGYGEDKE